MQVKVWNDNDYPFTDPNFEGVSVTIPPHSFIEMEYYTAVDFKGRMSPIVVDGNMIPKKESYKMIRIEVPKDEKVKDTPEHKCFACGKSYESQRMLALHVEENHELHTDDEAETEIKKRGRPKKDVAA